MTGHMDRARMLAEEGLDLAEQTEQETYLTWRCARRARCAPGQVSWPGPGRRRGDPATGWASTRTSCWKGWPGPCSAWWSCRQGTSPRPTGNYPGRRDRGVGAQPGARHQPIPRRPCRGGDRARRPGPRRACWCSGWRPGPRRCRGPWILAVSARSRGLLNAAAGELDAARSDYERALAEHESLDMPGELGSTLLCLGRLHRRRNERQRAQEQPGGGRRRVRGRRGAAAGRPWPARSLAAPGRRGSGHGQLTPTELQVCRVCRGRAAQPRDRRPAVPVRQDRRGESVPRSTASSASGPGPNSPSRIPAAGGTGEAPRP